jgi:hypothetical protein
MQLDALSDWFTATLPSALEKCCSPPQLQNPYAAKTQASQDRHIARAEKEIQSLMQSFQKTSAELYGQLKQSVNVFRQEQKAFDDENQKLKGLLAQVYRS